MAAAKARAGRSAGNVMETASNVRRSIIARIIAPGPDETIHKCGAKGEPALATQSQLRPRRTKAFSRLSLFTPLSDRLPSPLRIGGRWSLAQRFCCAFMLAL